MERENILIQRILNALDYLTIECEKDYCTAVVVEYKEIQSIKYPCKEDFEWIKKTIDAINECYTYITDII